MKISIVSPVYQAEDLLEELVERLIKSLSPITPFFEIILVDDGSCDKSWEKIHVLCQKDARVTGISLSRNFGQHPAIMVGVQATAGEWVVVMDCDLQDRPEEISALYTRALEGYDTVLAQRIKRQDPPLTRLCSCLFYKVLSFCTGHLYDHTTANFGIYHRNVIYQIIKMERGFPYFPSLVKLSAGKQCKLPVAHSERPRGETSYSFKKKVILAVHVILSSFRTRPQPVVLIREKINGRRDPTQSSLP